MNSSWLVQSRATACITCPFISIVMLAAPSVARAQSTEPPSQTFGSPALTAAGSRATAICDPTDQPETGMQGETPLKDIQSGRNKAPYFCGMRIVGHVNPYDRANSGIMKRSRTCAYLTGAGVAVIDASDPAAPKAVGLLKEPGALGASETIDVIDVGERHLLIAGQYSNGEDAVAAPSDLYDISDCTQPKHLANYKWPGDLHVLKFSPDGKRIYASRPFGTAGLMVMDISDLSTPKFLGNFPLVLPGGRQQRCHDLGFSENGTRMYCAGSIPTPENRKNLSGPSIWDVTQVGNAGAMWPVIRFVGESDVKGQGDHHAPLIVVNGKRYLVAANELRPNAFPRIFDISDEKHLQPVSDFRLEANDRALSDPEWAKANSGVSYGLHYNSAIDNAFGNIAIGMFSFMGAGSRIVDLRDPLRPREVAYYHPGAPEARPGRGGGGRGGGTPTTDSCTSHEFFIQETGHIWFSCQSGLYVAELSAAVKAYLGVPPGK